MSDEPGFRPETLSTWEPADADDVKAVREALRKISSGVHLVDHFYAGECGGECARQLARVALAAGREEA